jgi:23S rRNA pseudouridine2605 synthase
MRVQRALARAGVASRRKADELVAAGRVTINGTVAEIGQTVDTARDKIAVDGQLIGAQSKPFWLVLNKPAGILTTRSDPGGRETVFDLVEDRPGLTYVGRLDYMTEGVLLLTTDGAAANALMHPSREVERTYVAIVRGDAPLAARLARAGVQLDDGLVCPRHVDARALSGRRQYEFEVTLAEGRNREVRRLCEALNLTVERLVRTAFGPVRLGSLPFGETRSLTRSELDIISAMVGGTSSARRPPPPRRSR